MKRLVAVLAATSLICVFASSAAFAENKYWDLDDANAGAGGASPAGVWDVATSNWSTTATGDPSTNTLWVDGDTAIFSAGTDATGSFTVTSTNAPTDRTAAGIIVEEGTITFAGPDIIIGTGTVELKAGTGLITAASGGGTNQGLTFIAGGKYLISGDAMLRTTNTGNAGSFVSSVATIELANNANLSLDFQVLDRLNILQTGTIVSGTGGIVKTGAGALAFAAPSTYSGSTTVNDGELRLRTGTNRLPIGTDLIVNSPGILNVNGSAQNQQVASLSGNGRVGLGNGRITINGTANTTFSGTIEDTANVTTSMSPGTTTVGGQVTKNGTGILTLTGANTYTGVTTISGGTLLANNSSGSATGAGTVTVASAGTIGGSGIVSGAITNNGTIAPGDGGVGTLTTGAGVTMAANSHLAIQLSGANADKLVVGGALDLSAIDNLDITGTGTGSSWVIASYASLIGTFDAITSGYSVDYGTGTSSQITLMVAAAALLGDFNTNGTVDAADYAIWRDNDVPNAALPNDNGVLTQADRYSLWMANFGKTGPGSGAALSQSVAAVPEPGTLVLLFAAAGMLSIGRRVR